MNLKLAIQTPGNLPDWRMSLIEYTLTKPVQVVHVSEIQEDSERVKQRVV